MQSRSAFFVSAPRDWEKSRSRLMNSRALLMPVCLQGAWIIKPRPVFFIYATRQRGRFIVIVQWLLISRSMWSTSCKKPPLLFLMQEWVLLWVVMSSVTGEKCMGEIVLKRERWQGQSVLCGKENGTFCIVWWLPMRHLLVQLTDNWHLLYAGYIKKTIKKKPDWGKYTFNSFNCASAMI